MITLRPAGLRPDRPVQRPATPPDDYRGDTYARFVLDVLDTLQVQRFVIGGNSLGGEVAWRTAALAPQRVRKLILVDAAGYAFDARACRSAFAIARMPVLNRLSEHLLPRPLVAQSLGSVYGDPARRQRRTGRPLLRAHAARGQPPRAAAAPAQLQMGEQAERIATLKLPTLVLWGGRDRLIPPDIARRFAADIPGAS